MKYKILINSDITSLEEKAQDMVDVGWEPKGGVAISSGHGTDWYHQAMILRKESKLDQIIKFLREVQSNTGDPN